MKNETRFNITMILGVLSSVALSLWVFIPLVFARHDLSTEWKIMLTVTWILTLGSAIAWLAERG